jgi:hypothetical protein
MKSEHQVAPAALLFTAPGCPHCPGMKQVLSRLLDEGMIGSLELADASVETERAQRLGVQSVPWLRLGSLEFAGQMTPDELRRWARLASTPEGLGAYFFEMLKTGRRAQVEAMIREDPQRSVALAALMDDPEARGNTQGPGSARPRRRRPFPEPDRGRGGPRSPAGLSR